jgi:glycosyltransferase involved in cell wall biosynthesis
MKLGFLVLKIPTFNANTPYTEPLGGIESSTIFLMENLVKINEDISFYSENTSDEIIRGIKHFNLKNLEDINSQKFDALIYIGSAIFIPNLKKYIKKTPIIYWTQHSYDQPAMAGLKNQQILKNLSSIIFISDWHEMSSIAHLNISNIKTYIIENGITPHFENLFKDLEDFKNNKKETIGIYASTPFRGLETLYKSSQYINEKIKIKVFSSMSIYKREDKIFQPLFEALKKNEMFEYNGSVSKSILADQFKSASFLTYPSTFAETFCITLLDALASGIEPIITDLGALKETSNNFGKIINLNQPNFDKIYAEKINESIKFKNNNFNSWCVEKFSQIEEVKKKYTYINIAKKWVEIIKKIIND